MSETTGAARPRSGLVSVEQIRDAARRLDGVAVRTPLIPLPRLEPPLLIKPESLQPTGSFKVRGAYAAITAREQAARQHGVVAHSSGNHGHAVAYAAALLGVRAVVVVPRTAPAVKTDAIDVLRRGTGPGRAHPGGAGGRHRRTRVAVRIRADPPVRRSGGDRGPGHRGTGDRGRLPERRPGPRAGQRRRPDLGDRYGGTGQLPGRGRGGGRAGTGGGRPRVPAPRSTGSAGPPPTPSARRPTRSGWSRSANCRSRTCARWWPASSRSPRPRCSPRSGCSRSRAGWWPSPAARPRSRPGCTTGTSCPRRPQAGGWPDGRGRRSPAADGAGTSAARPTVAVLSGGNIDPDLLAATLAPADRVG